MDNILVEINKLIKNKEKIPDEYLNNIKYNIEYAKGHVETVQSFLIF
jgi:hypothetical protein